MQVCISQQWSSTSEHTGTGIAFRGGRGQPPPPSARAAPAPSAPCPCPPQGGPPTWWMPPPPPSPRRWWTQAAATTLGRVSGCPVFRCPPIRLLLLDARCVRLAVTAALPASFGPAAGLALASRQWRGEVGTSVCMVARGDGAGAGAARGTQPGPHHGAGPHRLLLGRQAGGRLEGCPGAPPPLPPAGPAA